MAYSSNQHQLYNWGEMFGISRPKTKSELPYASFRYWVEANRRIIELRDKIGKEKIYLLNFDKLCQDPINEINMLVEFLGVDPDSSALKEAYSIPKIPESKGRYKGNDLSGFGREDISFMTSLGFLF